MLQVVEVLEPFQRDGRLESLLQQHHVSRQNRVLIFVLYKKEAARVQAMLQRRGWKVGWLLELPMSMSLWVSSFAAPSGTLQRIKSVETSKLGERARECMNTAGPA